MSMMKKTSQEKEYEEGKTTPKSIKTSKKDLHLKKLSTIMANLSFQTCKTFVLGISGGDCSGKKELIHYMFDKNEQGWFFHDSKEPVTILNQEYFLKAVDGTKYTSEATNWNLFYKQAVNLIIGNEVTINCQKMPYEEKGKTLKLKPAKLLVIEGMHIFMNAEVTKNVSSLINLKVFIDSDSDVRLSRRVYQDTQQRNMDLNKSVANYLEYIKPSYERQIEPVKQMSDIIIPHFGGGFNDHKKQNRHRYDSNIKVACNLLLTHLKEEMKKYEEEIQSQTAEN